METPPRYQQYREEGFLDTLASSRPCSCIPPWRTRPTKVLPILASLQIMRQERRRKSDKLTSSSTKRKGGYMTIIIRRRTHSSPSSSTRAMRSISANFGINTLVTWASQPVIYLIVYLIGMVRLHPRTSKNARNR